MVGDVAWDHTPEDGGSVEDGYELVGEVAVDFVGGRVGNEVGHGNQEADFDENDGDSDGGEAYIVEGAEVDAAAAVFVGGYTGAEEEEAGCTEDGADKSHDADGPGKANLVAETADEEGEYNTADAAGCVGEATC